MAVITKDLGAVSAYAVAVANGFTGTEAEWEQYMADAANNAMNAAGSATAAANSAASAAQSATEAAMSKVAAAGSAVDAENSALVAGNHAAAAAASATAAETAETGAETAQTAAEAAQAAAEAVAASIPEDYTELSEDVSSLKSALYSNITGIKKYGWFALDFVNAERGGFSASNGGVKVDNNSYARTVDKFVVDEITFIRHTNTDYILEIFTYSSDDAYEGKTNDNMYTTNSPITYILSPSKKYNFQVHLKTSATIFANNFFEAGIELYRCGAGLASVFDAINMAEYDNLVWEQFGIRNSGVHYATTTRIASDVYIPETAFKVAVDSGYKFNVFASDKKSNDILIPLYDRWQTGEITYDDHSKKYSFVLVNSDDSTDILPSAGTALHVIPIMASEEKTPAIMPYDAWFRTYSHRIDAQVSAPENTLAALKAAYASGYRWFECDLQMTSDNVPVFCHNDTIDATSDGTGTIKNMTYNQLLQYDFGSYFSPKFAGEKILTLETACQYAESHNCGLSIELKASAGWDNAKVNIVLGIIDKYRMRDHIVWNNVSMTPMNLLKTIVPEMNYCFYLGASTANIDAASGFKTASNRVEFADAFEDWTQELVDYATSKGVVCQAHRIGGNGASGDTLTVANLKTMIEMGFGAVIVQGKNITDMIKTIYAEEI